MCLSGWDADRLYNGVRLPSARSVSIKVLSTSRVTPDAAHSHMLMQWGQFIDHDVDFVPTAVAHARFSDGRHCNETCDASGPCFPIAVAADDPRVRRRKCIGFVRSSAMCGRCVNYVWPILCHSFIDKRLARSAAILTGRLKTRDMTSRDWTTRHHIAGWTSRDLTKRHQIKQIATG